MQRDYTYKDYKADLDALIIKMRADEKEAQQAVAKQTRDDINFLQDMRCIHKLAAEWVHLINADSTISLISAGRALLAVYKETRFSSNNYFPGVVGPRTLKLAELYLDLMRKAQHIIVPPVGNTITQPFFNLAAASEKKDARKYMKELEGLIHQYNDNTSTYNFRR